MQGARLSYKESYKPVKVWNDNIRATKKQETLPVVFRVANN